MNNSQTDRYCLCGCGQKTPIAKSSDKQGRYKKGMPTLYIPSHQFRHPRNMRPNIQNFWDKVNKRGEDECWEWKAILVKGYGQFWDGNKKQPAHRYSYTIHKGEIPDGMWVLHSCDNPMCVNPNHLWLGTPLDNVTDKMNKGRYRNNPARGERNRHAKLTTKDVQQIRRLMSKGWTNKTIAGKYPVDVSVISAIRHNRLWKDVK